MPPFPPIFAYVFFAFIWLLEVIFTLFIITIPISEVVAIFGDILIVFWLWMRLGPEAINKFRNPKANKKFIRRFVMQTIGELIPLVDLFPWNLWFIHKQYKDEVTEYNKKSNALDVKNTEIKENNNEIEEGDEQIRQELSKQKAQDEIQDNIESQEQTQEVSSSSSSSPWIARNNRASAGNPDLDREINIAKRKEKNNIKDLPEEMRLAEQLESPEALINKQTNYGKFETYEAERKRIEEEKKKKIEERKEKDKAVNIKVKQDSQVFAEKKSKEADQRYGESSELSQRLRDRASQSKIKTKEDGYREEI